MQTLSEIQTAFADRDLERTSQRAALLHQVRAHVRAIVEGSEPQPHPATIISVCDALGVSFTWFERAVANCRARLADFHAARQLPELNDRYRQLRADHEAWQPRIDEAQATVQAAVAAILNPDHRNFDCPFRLDAEPAEFANIRALQNSLRELEDERWQIKRQAYLVAEQIRRHESSINRAVWDENCADDAPWDFLRWPRFHGQGCV